MSSERLDGLATADVPQLSRGITSARDENILIRSQG